MKAKLIIFSVNRLTNQEKKKIGHSHSNKLHRLLDMKSVAEKLETNPNETIVNLSGLELTSDQVEVLRLGLRHGLATRSNSLEMMAVAEDIILRPNWQKKDLERRLFCQRSDQEQFALLYLQLS